MTIRRTMLGLAIAVGGALGLSACNNDAGTGLFARTWDPVVLTGADLGSFVGLDPGDIVGFRYNSDLAAWEQVPVQVDERHLEDARVLRNGSGSAGFDILAYSDPGSNAGADPTATFDHDDELVFMADDTGGQAPGGLADPNGVVAGTARELTITDPVTTPAALRGPGTGYLYLFEQNGSLDPAAGVDYVSYSFADNDSDIVTDRYTTHFSARWTRDELTIEPPAGTGADILDRHRNLFALDNCVRSEDTFSSGPGGYATNVDGPVRAIRSYLGANSGTYTQREHLFYRRYEQVTTFLRVHFLSTGIMDFYDMAPAATGMIYRNSVDTEGVTVDGAPDTLAGSGQLDWETWAGDQGTLVSAHEMETDFTPTVTNYYRDDSAPPVTQCTGDAFEYGAAGNWITSALPNTDPTIASPPAKHLTATRHNIYEWATNTGGQAETFVESVDNPLTVANAPR
ncbi:MAG: hypothetical protein OES57_03175 [Acidimicrobiia bacterium]|nr:hypothetical protein [Acidimicrobiia bacterium]